MPPVRGVDPSAHLGDRRLAIVVAQTKSSSDDEQLRVEGVEEPCERVAEVTGAVAHELGGICSFEDLLGRLGAGKP